MLKYQVKSSVAAIALAPGLLLSQPSTAIAQEDSFLETILVQARKRDESLLEVPVAITALTAQDLRSANAFGLEDLAQLTPGLNFSATPGGLNEPTIRGLSQTDQNGIITNVGVFIDGIFINNRAAIEFQNMDLQQIEVLKGPQSALFGRDTFAGAINYRTRGATLGEFDGMVEGQIGSDELYSIRGSVNVPIGDYFAIRAFGGFSSFDGTITNIREGATENVGGWDERSTFGAQALFEKGRVRIKAFTLKNVQDEDNPPTRAFRFTENTGGQTFDIQDGDGGTFSIGSLPAGDIPNLGEVDQDPRGSGLKGSYRLSYGVIEVDLDFATVSGTISKSKSSYSSFFDNFGDPDNYTRPVSALAPTLSNYIFTNQTGDESSQESYELRLASNEESPFDWQFGYVHFDASTGGNLSSTVPLIADINTLETISLVRERIDQNIDALFGAVNVPVTPKLNIAAEFRYTWEDQVLRDDFFLSFLPFLNRDFSEIPTQFDYWSGRLSADYTFNDDVMVYASISRGIKTGGVNAARQDDPETAFFDPETSINYEIGAKGRLFDGRVLLNAALFYIDWNNLQATAPGNFAIGAAVVNGIGNPSSKGIELDATVDVTEAFQLRMATSIQDPTYGEDFTDRTIEGFCTPRTDAQLGDTVTQTGTCSATVSGTRLVRAPAFTFFASGTYTWDEVFKGFDAYVRADFSHEGSKFLTSLNEAKIDSINLVNIRLGLQNANTSVAFWMDNVFDQKWNARSTFFTDPSDGTVCGQCGSLASTRLAAGSRRAFGLTVSQRF
jgi:iron complex outermembrane receptor protein